VSGTGSDQDEARAQFDVADERSVEEIVALVNEAGLTPVFD
jgi:2-iminoacetate synthase ThiH